MKFLSNLLVKAGLVVEGVTDLYAAAAVVDTDKFVVLDGNTIKYRTGSQVLSDIGAEASIPAGTTAQYWRGDKSWQTLDTTAVPEGTNLYFTDARARAAISLTTTGTSGAATYVGGVLNIPQYQAVLTNPVTGTGSAGQVAYWSGTNTQTGSNSLFWDATNNRLGIGTNSPTRALQVQGTGFFADNLQVQKDFIGSTTIRVGNLGTIDASTLMQFALSEDGATVNGYFRRYRNGTGLTEIGFSNALTFMGAVTGTPAERMRIFANGNISINSATDNGLRFQVTGDGYFSGRLNVGNTNTTYNLDVTGTARISGTTGLSLLVGNTTSSSTTTPVVLSLGGTFGSNTAGSTSNIKLRIFDENNSTSHYGIGISSALLEIHSNNSIGFFTGGTASRTEHVRINNTGSVGIGATTLGANVLKITRNITGNNIANGILVDSLVNSDATTVASAFNSNIGTVAASFTTTSLVHFYATQGTFGAGSAVTNQFGFLAENTVTGATNNYGFFGNIASGTGRWNLYMNGSASNYVNGSLAVGDTAFSASWTRAVVVGLSSGNKVSIGYLASATQGATIGAQTSTFSAWADLNFAGVNLIFRSNGETERMRLDASGNLGLGTASPVTYTAGARGINILSNTTTSEISLRNSTTGNAAGAGLILTQIGVNGYLQNANAGILAFGTSDTERARFTNGGNFLLGTTTDAGFRLDVNGTMRVSGASTITTNVDAASGLDVINQNTGTSARGRIKLGSANSNWYFDAVRIGGRLSLSNDISGTVTELFQMSNAGAATFSSSVTANSFVKTGGTSTQYLMADGSTSTLTDPVTGTATAGQVTYWGSSSTITGSNIFTWDNTNRILQLSGSDITQLVNQTNTASASAIIFRENGTNKGYIQYVGSTFATAIRQQLLEISGSNGIAFRSGGSEYARFSTPGNFIIGSTTDNGQRFQVTGTSYFSDNIGIGVSNSAARLINIGKNISGSTIGFGIAQINNVASDVTNSARIFYSEVGTVASAFTLSELNHYYAVQGTFGAGSAVTSQYGFRVFSNLTGATSNFGFYGDIASGTGRWNLYMNGTAANYLAGNLAVGTTTTTNRLEVWGSGNTAARIVGQSAGNATLILSSGGVTAYSIKSGNGDSSLRIDQDGTDRLILASGGNLLVGSTTAGGSTTPVNISLGSAFGTNTAGSTANLKLRLYDDGVATNHYGFGVSSNLMEVSFPSSIAFFNGASASRTERMRINASGRVLIGSSSDSGETFQLTGTMRVSGASTITGNLTVDTETLFVDAANNFVGVGTTTPAHRLHVISSGTKSTIAIGNNLSGTYSQLLMYGGLNKFNWSVGAQYNVNNAFEITPSTAIDGTTFSTPALTIASTGAATFSTSVSVASGVTNQGYLLTAAGTTALTRLQMGTAVTLFSNNYNAFSPASQDNAAIPSWQIRFGGGAGADFYRIERSPAGSTTMSQFFNLDGTGAATFSSSVTAASFNGTTNNIFSTAGTEKMRLDSSGQLGLGATPYAWGGSYKSFDFLFGSIANTNAGNVDVAITQNAFFNGTNWISKYTGASKRYVLSDGGHIWFNGASATSGTAITMTQAMTLFATGNLAVGTSTDAGFRADINGTMRVSGASTFVGNLTVTRTTSSPVNLNASDGSNTTSTEAQVQVTANSTQGYFLALGPSKTPYKIITSGGVALYKSNTSGDLSILNDNTVGSITMAAGGSSTAHFTIASTGAATFSSTVTASSNITSTDGTSSTVIQTISNAPRIVLIDGRVGGKRFDIGPHPVTSSGNFVIRDATATVNRFTIESTGDITFSNNSTALAFIPSGATVPTNGMYLPAANTLGFATNTTEDMRLTSSGNLLIATTTDTGEKLQVNGDAKITGKLLLSGSVATAVNGDYSVNFSKTYAQGSAISNTNLYGLVSSTVFDLTNGAYSGSATYNATALFAQASVAGNAGTQSTQPIRAMMAVLVGKSSSAAMNLADFRYIDVKAPDNGGVSGHVIGDIYGLRIAALKGATNYTITNGWGVYQEGTTDNNYFGGKVLVGTATAGSSPVRISGLPTSATGLSAGDLWNDSGTIKIA